jgi:bifunctional non-homologous end joining protein LigD
MDCVAVYGVDAIPSASDWARETEWDGYRVCVIKKGGSVLIRTKMNRSPNASHKHIEEALARSGLPACVLDAGLVALSEEGRPVFQLLQQSQRNRATVVIYVFDVLNYQQRDLKRLPLHIRRRVLGAVAQSFPEHVRMSELLPDDVDMGRLLGALWAERLEGPPTWKARSQARGSSIAYMRRVSS